MATAPISRRLNLTRDQLAAFLTDQQQIRQFELLFSTVDELQVIVGTDFEFQADTAAANANNALAQIIALAQDTSVDDAVLNAKVNQALDAIPRLAQALELLALAPVNYVSGDVVGPTSATDNAVARFNGSTGKLIQNSLVTISDAGATTGITTLNASTSVSTPIVQASNSAGLSLKNLSGTTQMNVGAGGGDNISINVSTNVNGTNAQIDISPTGTGHVHIKPTGVNSVEIAPIFVGTIDNMTIGATTPKNVSVVDLSVTGALSFDAAQGTAGQVLTSSGAGVTPTWTTPTTGTVTAVSVASANGLAGTSSGGTTPALTLSTSVTGVLKGNGTAISAAVVNTDYFAPSVPITKTANFTVADTDVWLINNKSGSTCTATLPAAASWSGRVLHFQNYQVQTLVSASSNVVPLAGGAAGTSILLASSGDSATLVSDGSNWLMTQYVPNNILLLE
jgi:hypothetical protein